MKNLDEIMQEQEKERLQNLSKRRKESLYYNIYLLIICLIGIYLIFHFGK